MSTESHLERSDFEEEVQERIRRRFHGSERLERKISRTCLACSAFFAPPSGTQPLLRTQLMATAETLTLRASAIWRISLTSGSISAIGMLENRRPEGGGFSALTNKNSSVSKGAARCNDGG